MFMKMDSDDMITEQNNSLRYEKYIWSMGFTVENDERCNVFDFCCMLIHYDFYYFTHRKCSENHIITLNEIYTRK